MLLCFGAVKLEPGYLSEHITQTIDTIEMEKSSQYSKRRKNGGGENPDTLLTYQSQNSYVLMRPCT